MQPQGRQRCRAGQQGDERRDVVASEHRPQELDGLRPADGRRGGGGRGCKHRANTCGIQSVVSGLCEVEADAHLSAQKNGGQKLTAADPTPQAATTQPAPLSAEQRLERLEERQNWPEQALQADKEAALKRQAEMPIAGAGPDGFYLRAADGS